MENNQTHTKHTASSLTPSRTHLQDSPRTARIIITAPYYKNDIRPFRLKILRRNGVPLVNLLDVFNQNLTCLSRKTRTLVVRKPFNMIIYTSFLLFLDLGVISLLRSGIYLFTGKEPCRSYIVIDCKGH